MRTPVESRKKQLVRLREKLGRAEEFRDRTRNPQLKASHRETVLELKRRIRELVAANGGHK